MILSNLSRQLHGKWNCLQLTAGAWALSATDVARMRRQVAKQCGYWIDFIFVEFLYMECIQHEFHMVDMSRTFMNYEPQPFDCIDQAKEQLRGALRSALQEPGWGIRETIHPDIMAFVG